MINKKINVGFYASRRNLSPNASFAIVCQLFDTIVTHAKDVILDFALCCEVHAEGRFLGFYLTPPVVWIWINYLTS